MRMHVCCINRCFSAKRSDIFTTGASVRKTSESETATCRNDGQKDGWVRRPLGFDLPYQAPCRRAWQQNFPSKLCLIRGQFSLLQHVGNADSFDPFILVESALTSNLWSHLWVNTGVPDAGKSHSILLSLILLWYQMGISPSCLSQHLDEGWEVLAGESKWKSFFGNSLGAVQNYHDYLTRACKSRH